MIDDLPITARRALAYWFAFDQILGQTARVSVTSAQEIVLNGRMFRPPAGTLFLSVTVYCRGECQCLKCAILAGTVPIDWWTDDAPERVANEFNALSEHEREREWARWVPPNVFNAFVSELEANGLVIVDAKDRFLDGSALSGRCVTGEA